MTRILSIEDDPDLQHIFALTLQNAGYEVHYAFTGKEGYEKAILLNPDLILLDLMLPVMNGVEVLKALLQNKTARSIPVIVLTCYPTDANFVESALRNLGAVAYLRKPVQLKELLRLIGKVLASRRARTAPNLKLKRGAVRIDPKYRSVWINDRMSAMLPAKRFELLFLLLQSENPVPWEKLVADLWGKDGTKNDLEKAVQRLREDLGADAHRIRTTENGYELLG